MVERFNMTTDQQKADADRAANQAAVLVLLFQQKICCCVKMMLETELLNKGQEDKAAVEAAQAEAFRSKS